MKNFVKYFFILLVIVIGTKNCFGQKSKIDSLLTLIKKDKEDTNKVNHLKDLSREYYFIGSYDSVLHYGLSILPLAQKINFKKGIAGAYNIIGITYGIQDDYPKALDYYFGALKLYEELKDKTGIAKCCSNIGQVYSKQGDNLKASN